MNRPTMDEHWMKQAIRQAEKAASNGEVPVGAVLIQGDTLLSAAGNAPISTSDPTAHAEILALRQASASAGNYRLPDTTLYVTLEPCIMCAGALLHARIARIVYGASDPKTGALHSVFSIGVDDTLNHCFEVTGGILADECSALLKNFFADRRKK